VELPDYVDAFEQSVRSLLGVLETTDEDDWIRPTDLPGWRVREVVAHLVALERELLGDPPPPPLADYGPHVRDGFARHMEDGIAARRTHSSSMLVAELRGALEARLPEMRALRADDQPARVIAGRDWGTTELMRNRAFDAWMHEQDIRRALTRPGNLDAPGAEVTRELLVAALPFLVGKRAQARPGQSVCLEVTGPVSFTATAAVGENGRAALVADVEDTTARLRAEWETVVRLLGGRMSPGSAVVEMIGDTALARRVLDGFAVTG
jgi:uncharacterized protein (TIGR03083 family)